MRKQGWAISQRSGFKFPRNEMLREPLTGLLIHKSESDGYFEIEERYRRSRLDFNDPIPLDIIRPDISWVVDMYLQDEDDNYVTDERGNQIEVI